MIFYDLLLLLNIYLFVICMFRLKNKLETRFHVPSSLSHILVYLFYLWPSIFPRMETWNGYGSAVYVATKK